MAYMSGRHFSYAYLRHQLQSTFHWTLLPRQTIFSRLGWMGHPTEGDQRKRALRIPLMLQRHVHSVRLQLLWRDQGWGHQKGQIWLVGKQRKGPDSGNSGNSSQQMEDGAASVSTSMTTDFDSGRVVFESPVAPHNNSRLIAWFTPRYEEDYFLWYKVGSGGGHSLHLEDGSVQLFVQDDDDWNIRSNYTALVQANIIPLKLEQPSFFVKFFLTVIEGLIQQLRDRPDSAIDTRIGSMLQEHGLTTSSSGLPVILEILLEAQAQLSQTVAESRTAPGPQQPNLHHPQHRHVRLGRIIRLERQPPMHAGGDPPDL